MRRLLDVACACCLLALCCCVETDFKRPRKARTRTREVEPGADLPIAALATAAHKLKRSYLGNRTLYPANATAAPSKGVYHGHSNQSTRCHDCSCVVSALLLAADVSHVENHVHACIEASTLMA